MGAILGAIFGGGKGAAIGAAAGCVAAANTNTSQAALTKEQMAGRAERGGRLVGRGLLDVVDDDHIDRGLLRRQLQPKLLLDGIEEVRRF